MSAFPRFSSAVGGAAAVQVRYQVRQKVTLQSGDVERDPDEVNPGETIDLIIRMASKRASARCITVAFHNAAKGVRLRADEQQLHRIVDNLLSNAIKFSHENAKVRVSLRLDRKRRFVLAVADEGLGIAKAELSEITKPFYQVDKNLDRSTAGIGLGLTVVGVANSLTEHRLSTGARLVNWRCLLKPVSLPPCWKR